MKKFRKLIVQLHQIVDNPPCLIDRQTVVKCVDKISLRYRSPFILVYVYELSYETASMVLNIPLNTLKSRSHRGKEQFKKFYLEEI